MLQNPIEAILPPEQANLIAMMIISIPLSYLLYLIHNKYLMLTLSMGLTLCFQSLLFPTQKWYLWIQQQVVYLILIFAPRKYVGHIVIVESFIALTMAQLRRMYLTYGENGVDITGIFMMQLFNYIGLGYNYQNGGRPEESLTPEQLERRVVDKPSYLTYMGYVTFLPACLVGPVFEYCDYDNYLNRRGDYTNIPNPFPAVLREGGVFLLCMVLYLGTSHFHIDRVVWPQFQEYNYFYRLFYIMVCITHIQLRYVTAWSLGMMSMRASGITYDPAKNVINKDNSITYDFGKVQTTGLAFYTDPSFKVKADNWNVSYRIALGRYVYQNIYNPSDYPDERKRKAKQFQMQLATVQVSALWHGFYPGYYISFAMWAIYLQISFEIFRLRKLEGSRVNRFIKKYQTAWNLFDNFLSTFVMTYFGMPFHLMTFSRFLTYLKVTYCLPYIALFAGFILIAKMRMLDDKVPRKNKKIREGEFNGKDSEQKKE